jgi:spore germination protein GerM
VRRAALAVVALVLLAVGCGVPEDDQPQELSADQVPFGLLTTATTTTVPTVSLPPPERRATLYFVDQDGEIDGVTREVEDQSLRAIITALLETDTQSLDPGLTSNIPPETSLLDISVDDDIATIDLSAEFQTISGGGFVAAVAQIVFTATDEDRSRAVAFRVEGEPIEVQDEEGSLTADPVTRSDYSTLAA